VHRFHIAHAPPAQHGCPVAPHGTHVVPWHAKPALHVEPAQQTCAMPPHVTHVPPAIDVSHPSAA
jgi:hypothetical protein